LTFQKVDVICLLFFLNYRVRHIVMKTPLSSGRPTVGEVDLGALEFNYRQIQKRIPVGVKLLAVVKADAYGHGAIPFLLDWRN